MSWTIEKTDRNGNDIKKLEDTISLAARKNILMFCAATDQGKCQCIEISYAPLSQVLI